MPAYYTVIQYVPDPVIGERINVGVASYFEGAVRTRFLTNLQRVKAICGKDVVDFDRIVRIFSGITQDRLTEMMSTWDNSIQFTQPNASLRSIEETLEEVAVRFLIDQVSSSKEGRVHSDVVSFAKHTLSAAVSRLLGARAARSYVRPKLAIMGRFGVERHFDLGLKNGSPLHAIQAISFAVHRSPERSVEATAFLAEEIQDRVPLTVVVAPPPSSTIIYENARRTLTALGAAVVEESEFAELANTLAERLAAM